MQDGAAHDARRGIDHRLQLLIVERVAWVVPLAELAQRRFAHLGRGHRGKLPNGADAVELQARDVPCAHTRDLGDRVVARELRL